MRIRRCPLVAIRLTGELRILLRIERINPDIPVIAVLDGIGKIADRLLALRVVRCCILRFGISTRNAHPAIADLVAQAILRPSAQVSAELAETLGVRSSHTPPAAAESSGSARVTTGAAVASVYLLIGAIVLSTRTREFGRAHTLPFDTNLAWLISAETALMTTCAAVEDVS